MTVTQNSKVPDHVPHYQHSCPRHGWETCGVAASLVDPNDPKAEHACSRDVTPPFVFFGQVREIAPTDTALITSAIASGLSKEEERP